MKKANFKKVDGINHASGETCQFINLSIHDNPGSGIGSWKYTADTKIIGCYIYNNGYDDSDRGHGVGIYVQNISDKNRLIQDCVIFNNYYKGVEIWSATSGTKMEFVKNVILENNVLFNNGNPSGVFRDNVIVASNDNEGINVAKHIVLKDNVLYHNVDF
ncbi:MAG: right-handed parallel beta-helix repeat-containing protein, partial [Flavobacteriaceae bacterium]|nr:right-handed parallel beta-helix repeat-containing protein [Flavobacteriaceae bacterium]